MTMASNLPDLLTQTLRELAHEQYENLMRRALLREALNLLRDREREIEALQRTNARLRDELRQARGMSEATAA